LALLYQSLVVLLDFRLFMQHPFSRFLLLLSLLAVVERLLTRRLRHAARGRGLPVIPGPYWICTLCPLLPEPAKIRVCFITTDQ
jgi:hypothetical protein